MLTDLAAPGIDGEEMIERMRVCVSKLRVIVASGYPYEATNKPFLPKMLAEQIENRGSTRFLFFAPTGRRSLRTIAIGMAVGALR